MKISIVFLALFAVSVAGCSRACQSHLPPAQMLMEPGPGVGGPGPGVMMYQPGLPMPGRMRALIDFMFSINCPILSRSLAL